MLTMMIEARIGVGIQGTGIAECAFQQALAYAHDRKQGTNDAAGPDRSVAIFEHPDVKRMLLEHEGQDIGRARNLLYDVGRDGCRAPFARARERKRAMAEAALLTPVAKAFSTDMGVEVASEGIQVHGGMGYIEETGAAQYYRDARIAPIYEGTNGIQAIDLVTRKLPSNGGETVAAFIAGIKETVRAVNASNEPAFGHMGERLEASVAALEEASHWLQRQLSEKRPPRLRRHALRPDVRARGRRHLSRRRARSARPRARRWHRIRGAHAMEARHFAESLMGETEGLKHAVAHGYETVMEADAVLRIQ